MASSQLLPLLLLALALLRRPPGNSSTLAFTGVAFAMISKSRANETLSTSSSSISSLGSTITSPLSPSTESGPTSYTSPSDTGTTHSSPLSPSTESGPTSYTSPSDTGTTHSSPLSLSTESGPTSYTSPSDTGTTHSSPLSLSTESGPTSHLSPSPSNPTRVPTSAPPGTVTQPSSGSPSSELTHATQFSSTHLTWHWIPASPSSGQGDPAVPSSHRNPGVVVAVCLLLSVLLIGSVILAVKSCHQDASRFHKLDEESMENRSRGSSFAHQAPEWLSGTEETKT